MKTKRYSSAALILLLAAIAYGFFRTGRSTTGLPSNNPSQIAQRSAVDQSPLYTARHFVQMPTSTDEVSFAQETLRLADREMDLAFAAGIHELQAHPPTLSPEAKESETRLQEAQSSLDSDKSRVVKLTSALEKATGARTEELNDQLQQAKLNELNRMQNMPNIPNDPQFHRGGPHGQVVSYRGMSFAAQMVPAYPWYWSALLLSVLGGVSAWILNRRVRSLDRLR